MESIDLDPRPASISVCAWVWDLKRTNPLLGGGGVGDLTIISVFIIRNRIYFLLAAKDVNLS